MQVSELESNSGGQVDTYHLCCGLHSEFPMEFPIGVQKLDPYNIHIYLIVYERDSSLWFWFSF